MDGMIRGLFTIEILIAVYLSVVLEIVLGKSSFKLTVGSHTG